jgi:hypothetical protein
MDYMINENTLPAWSDLSELEQFQSIYWDAYKDAHGFRPRHVDTSAWTVADFEAELVSLGEVADRAHAVRLASEAEAAAKFEDRVANLMHGGTNRQRVIAWIADAEGANGDMEFLCFLLGLRYGYFN